MRLTVIPSAAGPLEKSNDDWLASVGNFEKFSVSERKEAWFEGVASAR